jgi:diadenosine tetraphosphatase ApaH/serine/threonine PP2A family protein phosphatase
VEGKKRQCACSMNCPLISEAGAFGVQLGINLTAGKFLFLGDYVDRGMQGLECLAYLFSLKVENPAKIYMLRGNHELRDVNGWVEHYGEKSFLWQCQARFGMDMGEMVWEECNAVFDRLPLAAVIDHDIFCVHGGIPRPLPGSVSRIQDIMSIPAIAGVCPPNEFETFESQQAASDCLWSDPAKEDQEVSEFWVGLR